MNTNLSAIIYRISVPVFFHTLRKNIVRISYVCRFLILDDAATLNSKLKVLRDEFPMREVNNYSDKNDCDADGALLMMSLENLARGDGILPPIEVRSIFTLY